MDEVCRVHGRVAATVLNWVIMACPVPCLSHAAVVLMVAAPRRRTLEVVAAVRACVLLMVAVPPQHILKLMFRLCLVGWLVG